jgi:hypothetical protein
MWWSRVSYCALSLTLVVAAVGCGSSGFDGQPGDDALTMSFIAFSDEGITQEDTVGSTFAQVDVCPTICDFGAMGIFGDEVFESFTETVANAIFVNNGTADILLDHYTVSILNSNIPPKTVSTAALLPAGRCSNAPTTHCGLDSDCLLGQCLQTETPVQVSLFDFITKELVIGDAVCPGVDPITDLPTPGTVVPQTKQVNVTFSGSDESGERFTVRTGLTASFFDANNCGSSGSSGG